ncbi:MAG: putative molybdenum carrier protein [Marinobacterium sp.]|nr:putative molybdenum carrier protein [Marinobacterium sp.]
MLKQIISSGQAGGERAALDAALACDFSHGGFCMKGRLAEDGHIDASYRLLCNNQPELNTIEANVQFSDASVIFYQASLLSDQEFTLLHCIEEQSPYKLLDMDTTTADQAAGALAGFIQAHRVSILNVSAPAPSSTPHSYDFCHQVINQLLHACLPLPPGQPAGQTAFTRLLQR